MVVKRVGESISAASGFTPWEYRTLPRAWWCDRSRSPGETERIGPQRARPNHCVLPYSVAGMDPV